MTGKQANKGSRMVTTGMWGARQWLLCMSMDSAPPTRPATTDRLLLYILDPGKGHVQPLMQAVQPCRACALPGERPHGKRGPAVRRGDCMGVEARAGSTRWQQEKGPLLGRRSRGLARGANLLGQKTRAKKGRGRYGNANGFPKRMRVGCIRIVGGRAI